MYDVFEPIAADSLSDEEKKKAISLLIFLKEKQNGTVKAHSVYNNPMSQKEEAASPMVALESVFVTTFADFAGRGGQGSHPP
jgi:hypothetical protein